MECLETVTDGRGGTRRTEYAANGLVTASVDALGNRTAYAYDQFGRLVQTTDPLGNSISCEYDALGRKTYEGGATYPVRYSYDVFGNKASMTTYRNEAAGNGDTTTWLREFPTGVVTNKVYADGKGPRYRYDAEGRTVERTWARGIVTSYAYDAWGSLTNTVYSDGTPTISLAYDAMGRMIETHDAAGVTTFAYDAFGSVTNETVIGVAGTNTVERFYDSFGRDAGYALNGIRQSTLAYDPATGRLATMYAAGSDSPFTWNYLDGSDLKSSLTCPNGLTASWSYDAKSQLLQVKNAFPTNTISQYDYAYDAAGHRVQIARSGSAMSENRVDVYGYNARSELVSGAKLGGPASVPAVTEYAYQYDDIGNRLTSLDLGTNRTYTANNLNQYTLVRRGDPIAPQEEFEPQFDDDGNQTLIKTSTGIWSVTYNGENRPILWTCIQSNNTNNQTISMTYDRMGRRVTKNGKRFVYDGYLQIADNNGNAYIWDPTEKVATRPLMWLSETFVVCYTHDGSKNVSEVMADGVSIAAHYEYAPFGDVVVQCGECAEDNPWRFSSEYADDAPGLIYYNYRHYSPGYGRWLRIDPVDNVDVGLMCFSRA